MRSTTSIYYIEVQEGKIAKRVPHTKGTKHTDFIDPGQAKKFLDTLVENNPPRQFRLCKSTTTETEGPWLSKLK